MQESRARMLALIFMTKCMEDKKPFMTWDSVKSFFGFGEPEQYGQSARVSGASGGIDDLLHGIMMTESGGNPLAYNVSGATGAFQFMPGTARDLGLRVDSQVTKG
jgi:hypothetical protein